MLFRYMLKELRNGPRFALLFILNMSLGLLGFISLDALKRNFDDRLQDSARTLLGADLSISARRPLSENETKIALESLPRGTKSQTTVSLYTMAATGDQSSLVELRSIDDPYPYYGDIILEHSPSHRNAPPLSTSPSLWIAPELAMKLSLKQGSEVTIGTQKFRIADLIKEDTASSIGAGMAPRIYMSRKWLESTGLMAKGNTATHSMLYEIPSEASIETSRIALKTAIPDASIRVRSYQESGQDNGRMLGYLSDYLGLVALVAFSLAGIGAAYLYRDYFERRSSSIAILISLGLTHNKALLLYLFQVCFLGIISAIISSLLALGLIPSLMVLLKDFSPVSFNAYLPWQTVVLAIVIGAIGSVFICLPMLQRLRYLKPALLFHEQSTETDGLKARGLIAYIPLLLAFYGLSIWQAHSLQVGSLFFGMSVLVVLIFAGIAWCFLTAARSFSRSRILPLRLGAMFLRAHPSSTLSAFIAIGLGSTLINLIPQLQSSLLRELDNPAGQKLPSFFLFDIQEDQVNELQQLLTTLNSKPQTTSPMIMARLTRVNDQDFSRDHDEKSDVETREAEREQSSRNRGVNLSYRSELAKGESIDAGQFFKGIHTGDSPGEVSLETNYASRLKIKLGDLLTFDVQGLEVKAIVTSLRQVKWNTFEPNFFIVLQPGIIDDAPKTFLMNIPDLPADRKIPTQLAIVKAFPNVSVIDVTALVAKITSIVEQMALVLNVMAYLTSFTGMLVIYSIAQHQALARRWDHNLLKILGAEFPVLLKASAIEFVSISGLASLVGAAIGLITSYAIAKMVFKGVWHAQFALPIYLSLGLVSLCLVTAMGATIRILGSKPELQIEA
ncbi:MAG: hypothetical protein H7249_12980 [Chitinophagaceae bacterium]|nr:hypothetical protein [Oligoflexus sp.]